MRQRRGDRSGIVFRVIREARGPRRDALMTAGGEVMGHLEPFQVEVRSVLVPVELKPQVDARRRPLVRVVTLLELAFGVASHEVERWGLIENGIEATGPVDLLPMLVPSEPRLGDHRVDPSTQPIEQRLGGLESNFAMSSCWHAVVL